MFVEGTCQRDVDVADVGESVLTIADRMRQRSVGCLVVVNEVSAPIGIVTDRDLVMRVLAEGLDPYATRIEEIMTVHPKTVTEGTVIEDALRLMRSGAFRRVPIVSRTGKLVGILALDDILMTLAQEFTQASQVLHSETPCAVAGNVSAKCSK